MRSGKRPALKGRNEKAEDKRLQVGYLRVSTPKQEEEGYGLDYQQSEIIKHAGQAGKKIDVWFKDVLSGKRPEREDLENLRDLVRAGQVDTVWCWRGDRVARNVHLRLNMQAEFAEFDTELILVTQRFDDTPMGRAMSIIWAVFDELELATITERLSNGKKTQVRTTGRSGGSPPLYGYRAAELGKGHLVVVPEEAKIVRLIFDLRSQGMTMEDITYYLNSNGYRTMKGKPWTRSTVRKILAREGFYRGESVLHESLTSGPLQENEVLAAPAHEPILPARDAGEQMITERVTFVRKPPTTITRSGEAIDLPRMKMPATIPAGFRRTVEEVLRLHDAGVNTYTIITTLNAQGLSTQFGSPLRYQSTYAIIENREDLLRFLDLVDAGEVHQRFARTERTLLGQGLEEREHLAVAEALRLYDEEGWTLGKIAEHLDQHEEFRHPLGNRTFAVTVRRMILGQGRYAKARVHLEAQSEPQNKPNVNLKAA